jgi:peptide/nickel transport system substrate-binding protein
MRVMRRFVAGAAALAAGALLMAACGTSPSTKASGSTVTMALPPQFAANYIFPLQPPGKFTTANDQYLAYLMWRPLYWYGVGENAVINTQLSLADLPVWSADSKTVTITLKPYKWSDGQLVTTRDVQFWQDLMNVEKTNWGAYVPKGYPDNITSMTVLSPSKFQLHLNQAYNHDWFLYNELSQITPIPQHVWDKTSASGKVGNYDMTPAGAKAVYKYLNSASNSLSTWTTDPLWQVVDGPWKITQFTPSTGQATFVPNPAYSGPVRPTISKFEELPFTKDSAEYNQITAGTGPDIGYVPYQDVSSQKSRIASLGYTISPWILFSFNYMQLNLNSAGVGPILSQLYARQALQYVIDQPAIVSGPYGGNAVPSYGPVPVAPPNSFVDTFERSNPYPYSPSKAKALLTSHGWTIKSGVATCTKPGSAANECGAGVAAGAKMAFNLQYAAGFAAFDQEMASYKSDASLAGIQINLTSAPFSTVVGNATPCTPGPKCTWQIQNWGGGWVYSPDYYPTGGELYGTGAGSNLGSYSNPRMDALIAATHTASPARAQSALDAYQDFAATQLPGVIFEPEQYYQITLVKNGLTGVTPQNAYSFITPESFRLSK